MRLFTFGLLLRIHTRRNSCASSFALRGFVCASCSMNGNAFSPSLTFRYSCAETVAKCGSSASSSSEAHAGPGCASIRSAGSTAATWPPPPMRRVLQKMLPYSSRSIIGPSMFDCEFV